MDSNDDNKEKTYELCVRNRFSMIICDLVDEVVAKIFELKKSGQRIRDGHN